jgi:hypothetical protein
MKSVLSLALLVGLGLSTTAVQAQAPSCGSNTDPFPATGQTESYPAFTVGSPLAVNDDGAVRAGGALSYTGTGPTIIDNNTGLEWEVLGQPDNMNVGIGSDHDFRTKYWWSCPSPGGVACAANKSIWDKVALLNAENGGLGYANHNDWRVPNIKELQSIVDYEAKDPAVDSTFNTGSHSGVCDPDSDPNSIHRCSFTQGDAYWSSTTEFADKSDAWLLGFFEGAVFNRNKVSLFFVRLVRGGCVAGAPPAPGGA